MIERILYNGNIITLDRANPRPAAMALYRDRIVAVGEDSDILSLAGANTIKENLERRTVVPGLTDAHLHWQWTARALSEVDVFEVPSKQLALERVAERMSNSKSDEWITGHGWTQDFWPDKQFPTAADLDTVAPDNPVFLRAKSGHAVWINSVALRIAGIDGETSDPAGGHIGRDADGEPTGVLYETAADLVSRHIPSVDIEQVATQMKEAQKLALAAGLTGFHDFDGPTCLRALQVLQERGDLSMRVLKNINDPYIEHAHELGLRWGFGDDWLRIGGLKIFADGALGPRTALMVEAYESEPENFGVSVTDKETMYTLVSKASVAGIPSTIHAIGDRAIHDVLDVYAAVRDEEAQRGEARHTRRHRIEHVQIIHPDDKHRLAELDIIASMQPIHATSDYQMADAYWGDRSELAYNPRLQLDQGVMVAFGSDSPVDPFEPLNGIYAAVARRRPDGAPGPEGWYPQNRVSITEALHGWTTGPAYAAGMNDRLGQLRPGFLADLVVLDRDITKAPPDELLETTVTATMVGGRWHYGGV
jgi:predicted amidohydrolase YtcJ